MYSIVSKLYIKIIKTRKRRINVIDFEQKEVKITEPFVVIFFNKMHVNN